MLTFLYPEKGMPSSAACGEPFLILTVWIKNCLVQLSLGSVPSNADHSTLKVCLGTPTLGMVELSSASYPWSSRYMLKFQTEK